jgi:Spy/CpxP family protein refolding chaperone
MRTRTSNRTAAPWLVVLALASVPAACKGSCGGGGEAAPSSSGAASAASSAPVASARPKPANPIRAGGTAGMLLRSIQGLDLTDEQKATMEKIGNDLQTASTNDEDGGARGAMRDIHAELVSGTKAGKIDTAKVEAQESALESAARTRRLAEADALNTAHKMLDEKQRKTVAFNVRSIEEKRAARFRNRGRDAGAPSMARLKFEHYTKDLDLDADQQKKVQALYPKDDKNTGDPSEEARKQLDELLTAFEKSDFDARRFESAEGLKKRLTPMAETVKFLSQLAPVLKPDQRAKLSEKLDKERSATNENRMRHRGSDRPPEEEELLSW